VHKVQHKPINIQVRDPIQKEQKGLECDVVWRTRLSSVPPNTIQCTMPVQIRSSHSWENAGALRYNSPDCPVRHQTVRCASAQRSTLTDEQCSTVLRQKSEQRVRGASDYPVWHRTIRCGTGLSGVAPDYPVPQEDKAPTVAGS
jgi:hypothetical protein